MKQKKKKERKAEKITQEEVPMYRAYGVTRRVRPWAEYTKLTLLQGYSIYMFTAWALVAILTIVSFVLWFPELWVKLVLGAQLIIFTAFLLTRTIRKRKKFTRKLKKLCKKQGYSMRCERSFFQTLQWNPSGYDFVLKTKDTAYYVKYLTIRKYRSTLYFDSPELLRLIKAQSRNRLVRIFSISSKLQYYPLDFQIPEHGSAMKAVKVLLLNPVCEEMKGKNIEGGYEATGNGAEHFGVFVYTGSGFLETLGREA